jgi:hypothetical protein
MSWRNVATIDTATGALGGSNYVFKLRNANSGLVATAALISVGCRSTEAAGAMKSGVSSAGKLSTSRGRRSMAAQT